jgi:hypothetical protein
MTTAAADATRLVRYGLDVTALPAKHDEYRELVTRCLADPAFREYTDHVAAALDLRVAAVDATAGIVVVPDTSSVFTPSWTWLREAAKVTPSADNRMIVGVALVGIAALCFPTASSLSDPALRRFTPADVDTLLCRHGQMLADGDTTLAEGLDAAWQAYAARKAIDTGPSGKRTRNCTIAIIERLCDVLASQRLLLRNDEDGQSAYRSTDRFRYLVAHHAGALAYRALIDSDASDVANSLTTELAADGHDTPETS